MQNVKKTRLDFLDLLRSNLIGWISATFVSKDTQVFLLVSSETNSCLQGTRLIQPVSSGERTNCWICQGSPDYTKAN